MLWMGCNGSLLVSCAKFFFVVLSYFSCHSLGKDLCLFVYKLAYLSLSCFQYFWCLVFVFVVAFT